MSTKGLHRKAAAAADAVALKQNEEKKRLCEKLQEVEHLSLSSVFVLKSLHLCQVTYRLFEGDGSSLIIGKRRRLSSSLEKYFDHVSAQSCQVVTCKRINLHVDLCNLAILVWADSIGYLFPSPSDRVNLMISFLEYFKQHDEKLLEGQDSISSLPWSDDQQNLVMFESLCSVFSSESQLDSFFQDDTISIANLLNNLKYPVLSLRLPKATQLYYALVHKSNSKFILNGKGGIDWISHSANKGLDFGAGTIYLSGNNICFDASRCSDSVTIKKSDEGVCTSSVLQRASKKWGTAFSDTPFSQIGVHRIAIRLDHCEKGHIFVGVATTQAKTDSYVGSDKYGWGMIGTQALWHDRSKVRL